MKKIANLIGSLLFVFILMLFYFKLDDIKTMFHDFITKNDKITIPKSNEYKRNYTYQKFTNEEDFIPHSKNDIENIFYNILNNGWNEFIFYCPAEYEECTKDVESISSSTIEMSKIAGYVSPYNSHQTLNTTISSYGEIYVKITKKYTDSEIEQINEEIKEIYSEYNLEEKTLEEKIKTFHDYLIKNTTYDEEFANTGKSEYHPSKAIGALLEHYAVCGGYTDAMALFLDYINVPNLIITNDNHAWNLVYYNDNWLHIDSTWNDAEIERFNYEFYLVNTQKLLEIDTTQHTFDENFFVEAK